MCPGVRFIPHTVLERPGGKMESRKYIFISSSLKKKLNDNYIILDGLEGDTRIYCERC